MPGRAAAAREAALARSESTAVVLTMAAKLWAQILGKALDTAPKNKLVATR